jgi:hypothetical protein
MFKLLRFWIPRFVFIRETERGGPCWLLKLRWMGTQRGQMKGALSWLIPEVDSLAFSCRYKRSWSRLGCSVGPVQFFSSPDIISLHLSSSPSKLGRQSCWAACLLVCASGFYLGFSCFLIGLCSLVYQLPQNQMCKQTCQQYKYTVYSIRTYIL